MNITITLILFMVAIILILAMVIKPIRLWLLDKEKQINICVAIVGLIVAVWFGFSADQLSNDANKLANVSKKISENDYFHFSIESDLKKKNKFPEIIMKSGSPRILCVLIKNRAFPSMEEPIKFGYFEERVNAESAPYGLDKLGLNSAKLSEKDFFLTSSFYYYFIVGKGLNGDIQANVVVYLIDNVEDKERLLRNSEFFCEFSKDDLISIESEANRYADIYFEDYRTKSQKSKKEISMEFETILTKYEDMLKRIELVYD